MRELEQCFCPNEQCKDHGLRSQGNIAVRGKYGKDKSRELFTVAHVASASRPPRPAHCLAYICRLKRYNE